MLERMEDSARPLSEADVVRVEVELGVKLPSSYREFLLRFNGGLPAPDTFPIEGMPKNPSGIVQEFFGIDCPIKSSNLKWNYEIFRTDTPPNLFPIACTPSGDSICLSLSGPDAGLVLLWDYYAPHSPSTYDNVYKIANSFDEFIAGLFMSPQSQR